MVTCSSCQLIESPGEEGVGSTITAVGLDSAEDDIAVGVEEQAVSISRPNTVFSIFFMLGIIVIIFFLKAPSLSIPF
jgi:hypothetical protein